jgi:hypothetical protein
MEREVSYHHYESSPSVISRLNHLLLQDTFQYITLIHAKVYHLDISP